MLRSAASPGSVGLGRPGDGVSGLLIDTATGRPPCSCYFTTWLALLCYRAIAAIAEAAATIAENVKGARRRPGSSSSTSRSLDLRLAELDVLLGHRIVFLLGELVGHRARVLLGDVIEPGIGARHQLDLDGGGFRHGKPL